MLPEGLLPVGKLTPPLVLGAEVRDDRVDDDKAVRPVLVQDGLGCIRAYVCVCVYVCVWVGVCLRARSCSCVGVRVYVGHAFV